MRFRNLSYCLLLLVSLLLSAGSDENKLFFLLLLFCILKRSNKMSGETLQREVKRFSSNAFHFDSVVAALTSVFAPLTISSKITPKPVSWSSGDSRRKLAGKLWRCSNLSPQQLCVSTLTGTSLIGSRETRFPDGTSNTVIKTYLLQLLRAMKGSVFCGRMSWCGVVVVPGTEMCLRWGR